MYGYYTIASSYPTAYQIFVSETESIHTVVANTGGLVTSAIEKLKTDLSSKRKKIVGLDCEWRFNERRPLPNKVATMQLCSENLCLIIQLFYLHPVPGSLFNFLDDPEITFVGVKIEEDVAKLRGDYGLSVRKTADIGDLAVRRGYGKKLLMTKTTLGLKDIAREVVGLTMDKPLDIAKSDWQVGMLSVEQIRYACIDAYASHAVGQKLLVEDAEQLLSFYSSYPTAYKVFVEENVSIRTIVADTGCLITSAIEKLRTDLSSKPRKIVGLNCEWRPNYPRQLPNKVATMQLCSENLCVIIQLFHLNYIPNSIRNFLDDPAINFVGLNIEEDVAKLRGDYGLSVRKTTDIRNLAVRRGFGKELLKTKTTLGLKDIAWEVAEIVVDKPLDIARSDWQVRILSVEQIQYACIDVYAAHAVGHRLLIENAEPLLSLNEYFYSFRI